MVGWNQTIKNFFTKKPLFWKSVPKRLTPGIKKLISGQPNNAPHRWSISTNPKTGKKTVWSIVRNHLTKNGNPRIQRILTPNGIRYLLEGRKGFISTHRAKTMMGPSSRADPESNIVRSDFKHILGGLKEKYKPKPVPKKTYFIEPPRLGHGDYLEDIIAKKPNKRIKSFKETHPGLYKQNTLSSVPKISKPLNRMRIAPTVPINYKGTGFYKKPITKKTLAQDVDPDLWDYDEDPDLWDYTQKPPPKRQHSKKVQKEKKLGVYKSPKQKQKYIDELFPPD